MKQSSSEQKPGNSSKPATPAAGRRSGSPKADTVRPACARKTTIGGQALIEGLLMIGPEKKAMAVRKADGSIQIEQLPVSLSPKTAEIPFIRGSVRLFRQLVTGTSALMRSAELSEEGTVEPVPALAAGTAAVPTDSTVAAPDESTVAAPVDSTVAASGTAGSHGGEAPRKGAIDRFIESHMNLMLYGSVVLGILFSVGLFILLPNLITSFINQFTPLGLMQGWTPQVLRSLIEGLFRITLFIGYLYFASRMKDIQRVWQYHGAEHKVIATYESGQPLTVENARPFSRFHPRCGTAFMFIVIIVSIIVFSFMGWHNRWVNLLIRFALVPVVAGIAYEIIRIAGRHDNRFTRAISVPGLLLQRLTTAEPDDSMLEVAIAAMNAVRPEQEGVQDKW